MSRHLPVRPNLEYSRKYPKELRQKQRRQNPSAMLADAQHAAGVEYGCSNWAPLEFAVADDVITITDGYPAVQRVTMFTRGLRGQRDAGGRGGRVTRIMHIPARVALVLLFSMMGAHRAAAQATTAAPIVTRMVDVDGIAIRVRTAGFDNRRPGQPAIIFESGGSAPLETWDAVLPAVARFAPVVAYDRAGTGESAWDGLPPTLDRVAARLNRLLATIAVVPPYILVGHSWGGALVRYFAGRHPQALAGMLYIDPTDITLTRADMVALFESIGAGPTGYDAFNRIMKQSMASLPAPLVAEANVITELIDSDLEQRGLGQPPPVPASVIVAGRVGAPPQGSVPFDTAAYAKAMHESQVRRLRAWVSEGGTFDVATSSGHSVQVDDPERVIDAIRHLVERAR